VPASITMRSTSAFHDCGRASRRPWSAHCKPSSSRPGSLLDLRAAALHPAPVSGTRSVALRPRRTPRPPSLLATPPGLCVGQVVPVDGRLRHGKSHRRDRLRGWEYWIRTSMCQGEYSSLWEVAEVRIYASRGRPLRPPRRIIFSVGLDCWLFARAFVERRTQRPEPLAHRSSNLRQGEVSHVATLGASIAQCECR
jgi:hypothetical protein